MNSEDPEYGIFDFKKIEAKIATDYVDFGKKLRELNDELREARGMAQEARPLAPAVKAAINEFKSFVAKDVERAMSVLNLNPA